MDDAEQRKAGLREYEMYVYYSGRVDCRRRRRADSVYLWDGVPAGAEDPEDCSEGAVDGGISRMGGSIMLPFHISNLPVICAYWFSLKL